MSGVGETGLAENAVARVYLRDFRNYKEQAVVLHSGFNIVAGPNAQGKTNLLEALYLLASTQLLRGQRDAEAIREGADQCEVEAEFAEYGTTIRVILSRGAKKRALLNGAALPRPADLIGRLPCVCITAEDMALVRGDPADRRLAMDLQLSALSPAYLRSLAIYKRALEQRNSLLRRAQEHPVDEAAFEVWETPMAHAGAVLRETRQGYVDQLGAAAPSYHAEMAPGEALMASYAPKDPNFEEETLRTALAHGRQHDIARGTTTIGPHRDDLTIGVGGREARLFGSQGQQRTAVIALKLASWEVARSQLGFAPLLLLDDILSDLDERRRAALVETVIAHAKQAVLTCTEAEAAGSHILNQAKVFDVQEGRIAER